MKLEDVMVIRECNKDLIVSKSHTPIQYVKIIFMLLTCKLMTNYSYNNTD